MPIELLPETHNIYRLTISGTLRRSDLARCEEELAKEIERNGHVKLLCVLTSFEGWERTEDWNNMSFYLSHGDEIERIAIVGDEKWRSEALMFAAADLRKAPVEFFGEHLMAEARRWLSVENRNT